MSLSIQIPQAAELVLGHPDATGQCSVVAPEVHITSDEDVTVGELEIDVVPADPEVDRNRREVADRLRASYRLPEEARATGKGKPPLVLVPSRIKLASPAPPGSRFRLTVRVSYYPVVAGRTPRI